MRVLVTGGTGVVGTAAVTALLARGHEVRLLSRNADDDARQWPEGVEPWKGSVASEAQVRGAADGCDVVLHCAGIVDETPPEATFEKVNVGGTRNMVAEAQRAGVPHFVYVSSLGAERGESPYHRSKHQGEEIAKGFDGRWVILRPGNVYGPGDEVISLMLRMVRTLPAIPVVGSGDQPFEPVWVEDLGPALAMACERDDLRGRTLEIGGAERTSQRDLLDRLSKVTGRNPVRVPVPSRLAAFGTKLAELAGLSLPVNESQLSMLEEENVVRSPDGNALVTVFGITPTPLDEGLKRLADAQPEQLPEAGYGALKRKTFWADIEGSPMTAEQLFERFRHRFQEITPWHLDVAAEPGVPDVPDPGETLTMKLPLRGHIQVRVEEVTDRHMTFMTLEGHPLAGAVRFAIEPKGGAGLRARIDVWDKAASFVDWVTLSTVGDTMQNATWEATIRAIVAESGGEAPDGVKHQTKRLDERAEEKVEEWLEELVVERKRVANADVVNGADVDAEPGKGAERGGESADVPRAR